LQIVDKIDTSHQFHQQFTHLFFIWNFVDKNYKAVFWVWNFLRQNSGKKSARKMLMKLTLGGGRWLRGLTALKSFHSIAFIVSKSKNFKREKYTFEASKRISAWGVLIDKPFDEKVNSEVFFAIFFFSPGYGKLGRVRSNSNFFFEFEF
jgi:hypothetical protein